MKYLPVIFLLTFAAKCGNKMPEAITPSLDIQGHRGCRGLMPENSIPAFLMAIELGVQTLEMDVVISGDRHVIVSHEPYFSHEFCQDPSGKEILPEEEKSHNIFQKSVAEIQRYDCGTKIHPRFPDQIKTKVYKPTLSEVFERVEPLVKEYGIDDLKYNIEIKRQPEQDGEFHPAAAEFVDLVLKEVNNFNLANRVIIQSFDAETLNVVRAKAPNITLAWLIDNNYGLEQNLTILGFTPDIYSPNFRYVDAQLIQLVRSKNLKIIPWTVNDPKDISKMISIGVDGIISDYPDRVKSALDV